MLTNRSGSASRIWIQLWMLVKIFNDLIQTYLDTDLNEENSCQPVSDVYLCFASLDFRNWHTMNRIHLDYIPWHFEVVRNGKDNPTEILLRWEKRPCVFPSTSPYLFVFLLTSSHFFVLICTSTYFSVLLKSEVLSFLLDFLYGLSNRKW
jgi:hypothetical protein